MIAATLILLLIAAAVIGGLLALFAGRRFYALWLGLATFFFVSRVLDMALIRTPDAIRSGGGLLIAILVAAAVVLWREKVIRFAPTAGGFLVGALVAERLLGILNPEAGKYLFFACLLGGGGVGLLLFRRIDFDDAIVLLSAVWGAAFLSKALFDVVDLLLISFAGVFDARSAGFLSRTQLLSTLLWFGLAAIGVLVQRRIGYKPLPAVGTTPLEAASTATPAVRRKRVVGGALAGLLLVFLLAGFAGSDDTLSRSIRRTFAKAEKSLGLEAEAPGDAPWEWGTAFLRPQIELQEGDRILVVAPHPDDDILSTAGLVQQALAMDLPVKVVFFTNGDYNETSFALYRKEITLDSTDALRLGETRREEALAAQGILGVTPEQVVFLGYPDGGGLEIFEKHWGEGQPYRALLSTMNSVPYTFAQTPGAAYKGESIIADLERVVGEFDPTHIFTSHPGDLHPDHQTLPLYLQVALWNLKDQIDSEVYHFITHYGRWPQPRGYQPEHPLDPPAQYDVDNRWRILPITAEQRQKKLEALQAHKTQWGSGQPYLESVVRANELFDVIDDIPISQGEEVQVLAAETAFLGEALHLLPEREQDAFTHGEVRTVKLEGDEIVFAIELDQPLADDVTADVRAMGYRSDTPFGEMPKIHMELSSDGYKVNDGGAMLPADAVAVSSAGGARSEVRVPLALLGNPERLLLSAQTSIGDVPLDNIPWVFLNIQSD